MGLFDYNNKAQWWEAGQVLRMNNIEYDQPQKGHYKIRTDYSTTLMLYPKNKTIVHKKNKNSRQEIIRMKSEEQALDYIKSVI